MALSDSDYFQQYLDKYPWIFHVSGDKGRIGYFTFFALHIAYFILEVMGAYQDLGGADGAWFFAGFFGMFFALFVGIRFYLLREEYDTWLLITFGIGFVRLIISIFRNQSTVSLVTGLGIVMNLIIFLWFICVTHIRKKCRAQSIRDYKLELSHEADVDMKRVFEKVAEEEVREEQPKGTAFLDKEPNWNSKVTLDAPSIFCPKCGFGVVPGETECHVCGAHIDLPEPESEDAEPEEV